ncbi:transposase [Myroides injenensis]|nr:transposase [Myroides injenensis]
MKYRRKVLTDESGLRLVKVCEGISERYEIAFWDIGYESDHVYFLI